MIGPKEQIGDLLKSVLSSQLGFHGDVLVERPTSDLHGDYSSNIALLNSKKLGKNPMELANTIKNQISKTKYIEKIDVVKPGFINFWLKTDYLITHLFRLLNDDAKPVLTGKMKNQKIMLEFADPNPFKEFHIGHLRNITLGESFCRLLESQGAKVWRVNYQGDVGMHVAKAIYGLLHSAVVIADLEKKSARQKAEFLGKCYAIGSSAYEESEEKKKEIRLLNLKMYQNDSSIHHLWEQGKKWSLENFEEIYKRVGTEYDRYYFESEVARSGREIVLSHLKDGIFERHDGAVVFRGEHTRVFVTKEDYATYEAKDMALAGLKYKDFPYDRSIIITAHEQAPYFAVVLAAMRNVFPNLAKKTTHLSFGFVRLRDTKMSSRLGNIITGQWLLDEAKARIKKEFPEMDEATAEAVAVGAVKYSMLKFSIASDIAFSFEESISLEGNSGPYIQYTYARTQSVLSKSTTDYRLQTERRSTASSLRTTAVDSRRSTVDLQPEELSLLRLLHRFPEVIEEAAEKFTPNLLCSYLFDLASAFNLFYQKHKIIGNPHEQFRLTLTAATGQVLRQGLSLLGIEAPVHM